MTRTTYDVQDFRMRVGGRIVQNFRSKLGLEEDPQEDEEVDILRKLEARYKRVTDGIALDDLSRRRTYEYDGVITNYGELCMVNHYLRLCEQERVMFRDLKFEIREWEIWNEFLVDVKGVGPAMASVMVSEFDPHKGKYVSSFWKYAGLDVADDGKARSRRSEHLREIEYEDSDGNKQTRKGLTFNPFLHDKILGVLGPCLLRSTGKYKDIYDDYRHRLDHEKKHEDKSDGHKHRMGIRYMVKQLVADLYEHWRPIEGLPVHDPYREAQLGQDEHAAHK
jgi:hypothetical protein